jgi:lipopolysaccharide transport system ATP-binding protein
VGDAEFQKKAIGKMQDISSGGGRTVLFVSHNMSSIRTLCTHGILIKNGQIALGADINTIISTYLSNVSSNIYEYFWNDFKPQIEKTILKSIQIVDPLNTPVNHLYSDQFFYVKIVFNIESQQVGGGFTLIFNDNEGNCIFGSIFNQNESFYGKLMENGDYSAICEIPANLLNDQIYYISLVMFSYKYDNPKLFENILRIEIMDSKSIRNDFTGKYEGTLRPKLNWKYEKKYN